MKLGQNVDVLLVILRGLGRGEAGSCNKDREHESGHTQKETVAHGIGRVGRIPECIAGAILLRQALVLRHDRRSTTVHAADLTDLTIAEAGRQIADRQLTSLELTHAYLKQIEDVNPRINAYITVTAEQALAQARGLDAELVAGRSRGALHGIPIALKDNIDTAGILTTAASAGYADRGPLEDAPVVTRLREAGAVLLGKLNMHEFAYGGTSVITHYGPVRNPWNLEYNAGGSSGGSAAAVAARMCAAALGTDTAASVRFPAACCGIAGLKATHGLASIRGIVPLSEMHDHVGPIARTVEDCAIVMSAIAGFDPLDPVSIHAEREDFRAAFGIDVHGFRIGIPRSPFFEGLDPEIEAATTAALSVLTRLTGTPRDVSIAVPETYALLDAETYAYHAPLVADPARSALYHRLRCSGCWVVQACRRLS